MDDFPGGHHSIPLSKEFKEEIGRKIKNFGDDCICLEPGRVLYPRELSRCAKDLYNFKTRPSDVFVVSFPKTGSTWTQEILWCLIHNANLDSKESHRSPYYKSPCFEMDAFLEGPASRMMKEEFSVDSQVTFLKAYENCSDRRIFKSHLHFNFFNPAALKNAKFVYVIRNPLDVAVSYFHFSKVMPFIAYPYDLTAFVIDFINGNCLSGSYLEHLKQWWTHKTNPNVYTLYFEDLKSNFTEEFKKLSAFVGVNASLDQIQNIQQFTNFSSMKSRNDEQLINKEKETKFYYRKGSIGSYIEDLSPELIDKLKIHYKTNLGDVKLLYNFDD